MTSTSAPQMVSFTFKGLEGLGPAENLPAIQPTTEAAPTASLEPNAARLSALQGYRGANSPNDRSLRIDLQGAMDESEQVPSANVSDSEDERNEGPKTLNISEKRKAQNSRFEAW